MYFFSIHVKQWQHIYQKISDFGQQFDIWLDNDWCQVGDWCEFSTTKDVLGSKLFYVFDIIVVRLQCQFIKWW